MKQESTSEREEKLVRMTTEPVEKLVCKLALPTIISMLVSTFYNMADTYFVGKIGYMSGSVAEQAAVQTRATAAVGVVFSLMAVMQAFGFFFGHGSGNFISRSLGSGNEKPAEKMAATGFFMSFIFGIIILVFGQIFAFPLARLLGASEDFLNYTVDYMRIILAGAPIFMSSLVLNNQLRFQGNAFYAMVGISSGAVINLVLDPVFIFIFDMEVMGAALATVLSQTVSFIVLYIGTLRSDCLKIKFKNFEVSKFTVSEIIRGGLPSLCRQGLASISTACLNNAAGIYGATLAVSAAGAAASSSAVAAMSVVSRIMMFASSVMIGFGQGFQPVCGYNYGARKYGRVKKAFYFCVKLSFLVLAVLSVVLGIFAREAVALFRDNDPLALDIGARTLLYQCFTLPLMSWVVMSNMMLQTMGKVVPASLLAASRQGMCFLPAILLLPPLFGMTGVEIAQSVADVLSFALAIPITINVLKELSRPESDPDTVLSGKS